MVRNGSILALYSFKYQEIPGLAIALTSDKTEVVANFSLLFEFHQ